LNGDNQHDEQHFLTSSARRIGLPTIEGKMDDGKFWPAYPTLEFDEHEIKIIELNISGIKDIG